MALSVEYMVSRMVEEGYEGSEEFEELQSAIDSGDYEEAYRVFDEWVTFIMED